jgi:hypothetical protein
MVVIEDLKGIKGVRGEVLNDSGREIIKCWIRMVLCGGSWFGGWYCLTIGWVDNGFLGGGNIKLEQ